VFADNRVTGRNLSTRNLQQLLTRTPKLARVLTKLNALRDHAINYCDRVNHRLRFNNVTSRSIDRFTHNSPLTTCKAV
jgi:hypothetical protein